ncbi:hypothetical protein BDV23DRAFT_188996 [Aspergillus alliaceus]|uniref:Uncharacterized protein n=1 Tax=Petromyces alliaceus TaxID=209559 RepID=A0A5N7BS66_PETAA|nr:hypothetical protein BDV23DRAFT_188996 [Aspergillus alliaceus]
MSIYGYEDCVAGTFYGFTGTENNEFHPGYTFNLKWRAIDNGKIPLNISLGQAGGTLIDPIVSKLTTSSSTSISIPSTSSSSRSIGIGVGGRRWRVPFDPFTCFLFSPSAKKGQPGTTHSDSAGENENNYR